MDGPAARPATGMEPPARTGRLREKQAEFDGLIEELETGIEFVRTPDRGRRRALGGRWSRRSKSLTDEVESRRTRGSFETPEDPSGSTTCWWNSIGGLSRCSKSGAALRGRGSRAGSDWIVRKARLDFARNLGAATSLREARTPRAWSQVACRPFAQAYPGPRARRRRRASLPDRGGQRLRPVGVRAPDASGEAARARMQRGSWSSTEEHGRGAGADPLRVRSGWARRRLRSLPDRNYDPKAGPVEGPVLIEGPGARGGAVGRSSCRSTS